MGHWRVFSGMLLVAVSVATAPAQIDDSKRELIQLGYNQPLEGQGPLAAYAFYYLNLPHFLRTNLTLRMAVAPVYLDAELGIAQAISRNTDVGIGIAGGGFADSYDEVRQGKFLQDESFTGHGGGLSASIYHRFNPQQRVPLYGIIRGEAHTSIYERSDDTAHSFELPDDRTTFAVRTGFRFGGREPLMSPSVAMELSVWHELLARSESGTYGFNEDREVEEVSNLLWGRALLAYTLPKCKHTFAVSLTAGTSADPDRFSAYRLGGFLPLAGEFPLSLPGYYYQEISARRFVLLGGTYTLPLDRRKLWSLNAVAATAGVDYVSGLSQPGRWHSGVGGGFGYRSPSDAWQVMVGYAYGIDAIRSHGRGAHNIGILVQFDLERAEMPLFEPGENPTRSRGLERFFRWF